MKNHHEVGHFKNRLMIGLLSLVAVFSIAVQSHAATDCSTCHGMPPLDSADGLRQPATGAFKGSHQTHLGGAVTPANCTKCHGNSGYATDHAATSGNKIQINSNINSSPLGATYSKPAPFDQTATPVMGSCSSVNCHFEKTGGSAPVWGSDPALTDCNTCHATPRGASGSHQKHEAAFGGTGSCVQCHPNYGTSSFSHATSAGKDKIKVNLANSYSGGTATSWLPSQAKVYGSCSTASCHSDGRGNAVTSPTWGDTAAACTACHALTPATGSHAAHLAVLTAKFSNNLSCASCHADDYVQGSTPSATDHINGVVDVFYSTRGDMGTSYPAGGKAIGSGFGSCTTYCHSDGNSNFASPTWGNTSTGCNFCHPNLTAGHGLHVGTLLTEISFYAYTSTKSTSTGYKFGCANCHPLSVASHMNTTVDVDLSASAAGGHLKAKNGAWSFDGTLCNNVYCHSNGYKPGASFTFAQTPAWDGGTFVGDRCAACHGNSPSETIAGSTAHKSHVVGIHYEDIFNGVSKKLPQGGGSTVNAAHGRDNRSTTINCNICHAATVTSSANDSNAACIGCHNGTSAPLKNPAGLIADKAKHVNGNVDVVFINQKLATKAQLAASAFNGYTAVTAGGWARNGNSMQFKTYTSSYDVTKSTLFAAASPYTTAAGCLNIACHASIPVKWADVGTVTCSSCHTRLK